MKTQKDLLDEKIQSSPWANVGIGAGLASLLGAASYHVFKGAAPSEGSPPDQKGKDMTPLENALLNLVPLLIDATRAAEKDRDYVRVALERESTRADTLNDRLKQAHEKFVVLEEATNKTLFEKNATIAGLRAELQNLQRLYPSNSMPGVPTARRPGARRSNKKMT
jgi:hypothetical protein